MRCRRHPAIAHGGSPKEILGDVLKLENEILRRGHALQKQLTKPE